MDKESFSILVWRNRPRVNTTFLSFSPFVYRIIYHRSTPFESPNMASSSDNTLIEEATSLQKHISGAIASVSLKTRRTVFYCNGESFLETDPEDTEVNRTAPAPRQAFWEAASEAELKGRFKLPGCRIPQELMNRQHKMTPETGQHTDRSSP